MRVENTTKGQIHLHVPVAAGDQLNEFVVPGRHDGVNGFCDIPDEALKKIKKVDGVAFYFDSGVLKEVKPGFEAKPPAPTEEEQLAAQAAETARRDEEKAAKAGADAVEAARKQSEGSGKNK